MKDARMRACPKFDTCNANVCPLDSDRNLRSHGAGDTVCMWLLEAVKPGSEQRFKARGLGETLVEVLRALPDICSRWNTIRHTVDRAKTSGSRLDRIAPGRAG
jgi:hypothetical protein